MEKKFIARLLTKEMKVRCWIWVLEAQEKNGDGWPHWHILIDVGNFSAKWLVVKDIVGHVSPQMTELYQKHADNRVKREKLMLMPDLMGLDTSGPGRLGSSSERQELMRLIDSIPEESIPDAIKAIRNITT